MERLCQLLIVGFDGMDANILYDPANQGRWPNLESIWCHGNWGVCVPELAVTAPSWMTIYTGQSWREHGVYDCWARDIPGSRPFYQVRGPFFWDWMNAAGKSVGLINLPVTFPPRPLHGYMVSGFPVPKVAVINYPPNLPLPESYIVDYTNLLDDADFRPSRWQKAQPIKEALDSLQKVAEDKIRLLRQVPVQDIMALGFSIIDHTGHITCEEVMVKDLLLVAYDECDQLLGEVLGLVEADYVALVSDHGFDRLDNLPVPGRLADHTSTGIFAARGPSLVRNQQIRCQNWDVLPMLLEMVGVSPDAKKKGASHLIWQMGPPPAMRVNYEPTTGPAELTDSETAELRERFRMLGYEE